MEWLAQLQGQVVRLDTATPDAIQMATAIRQGASFFLTNDARLPSLLGLAVLVLEELRA